MPIGWCPVDRVLQPLNGFKAVLLPTINTTLHIQSTVYFSDYKVIINNLNDSSLTQDYLLTCRYHSDSDPLCPTFSMKSIIKLTQNVGMSYQQMAKFGGVIVIIIEWKCHVEGWIFKNYNTLYFCKPKYSFVRTDKYKGDEQTTYRFARYYSNGKMRTHFRSWQIRFVSDPKVTVREFSFYRFVTSMIAYNAVFYFISFVFMKVITCIYHNNKWNQEIDVSRNNSAKISIENGEIESNHHQDDTIPQYDHQSDTEQSEQNRHLIENSD